VSATTSSLEPDPAWLEGCPARFRAAVLRCARGETPANVAVMQLHGQAASAAEVEAVLERALQASGAEGSAPGEAAGRLSAALAVARAHPQAFATVRAVLDGVEHGGTSARPEEGVTRWAALFDAAVQKSAEGSVALYALGDPELLQAATREVVDFMRGQGLLGPDRDVLEIGCGIGRMPAALAAEVRSAVGIDISAQMIAAARQRHAGLANVAFQRCSGRDLAPFAAASFDVVFAVDSFPYIVQSGAALAEAHVREAARVLRASGQLLIFNFSYRGDPELDRADVARLAAACGFRVLRAGTRQFDLWDGLVFQLAAVAPAEPSADARTRR
jgi:SAM-dependent methyltransferase